MSTLLATKLHRPSISPRRVQRPQLDQLLDEGLAAGRQLTLVSAPAGFGKSTCVSGWVDRLVWPVTWLSLDPADDEPGRFFSYLIAALQMVDAPVGREIEAVLRSGQPPPGEVIAACLINDLQRVERPFVLVIDDLHLIQDGRILQVLESLVANLPNALHLVLITREDPALPLARLRANNRLTEIRAADLRFTEGETQRFMQETMGLPLTPADIAALEDRTEGWIVGLQLAGLSMRGRSDPAAFIASLRGSHRHILSYLTEEVLQRQPAAIQQFLLHTSILERLCAPLCDAILKDEGWGMKDEDSQAAGGTSSPEEPSGPSVILHPSSVILALLDRTNLFLVPLDDDGQWYRYHHLFAELLRSRLNSLHPGIVAGLHRRASNWYARASESAQRLDEQASFAGEAIRQALAAADYPNAVQLIEKYALVLIMQWYAKTIAEWMRDLPPEWSTRSPKANLAFAWSLLQSGDFAQAMPYIERLHAMFANPAVDLRPSLKAEWLALQSTLLNIQGKPEASLDLARQALEIVPEEDHSVRSQAYAGLAIAYLQLDDIPRAEDAYQQLIQLGRAAGNIIFELVGYSGLALMVIERGRLKYGFELASRAAERSEQTGTLPPMLAGVYGELGQVYYLWHQLETAQQYFQRAAQVSAITGFSDAALYHMVIRSRLARIRGDLDTAAREIRQAVELMRVEAATVVREEVISQQVQVHLALGELTAAETVLAAEPVLMEPPMPHAMLFSQGMLYNSSIRTMLFRGLEKDDRACLQRGIQRATQLIDAALQRQYVAIALEALLLRAQMHTALGDDAAGQADALKALELGQPEGFISSFVETGPQTAALLAILYEHNRLGPVQPGYVERILAAFGPDRSPQVHPPAHPAGTAPHPAMRITTPVLAEPLTDRQLDVLRLMAEGLKYEEIATRLYISVNTVRTYVKEIYGKLAVNNRTRAIALARHCGLI